MKIIIIGAGIIGISTAYELLKSGYDVAVVDRNSEPAMETSYGNAGLIAPGHSYAWTTPKLPKNLMKSLFEKQRAFRFKFQWDPSMWYWGIQFLLQCTQKKMTENTLRKHRLSTYSQKLFHQVVNETDIQYFQNKLGLIYIFRTDQSFHNGKQKMAMLNTVMDNLQILNRDELLNIEPALKWSQAEISGGIFCSTDESGSCKDFTYKLAEICQKKGATFHFDTKVLNIEKKKKKITRLITDKIDFKADNYILCCAAYSPFIAKMVGDYLPIYPVKGYSMTIPIINNIRSPIHSGIDEDNLLAFSLIGNKIRFTSIAEISGYNTNYKASDFTNMIQLTQSLFPDAFDFSKIEYWAGLRPMTPNGSPIFGKGKMENLYINSGHGHLGWTMCAGSAKIISHLISGKKPDLDLEGMTLAKA